MLKRLDRHDWQAHASEERHAPRMPRLLRRYLGGDDSRSLKALRGIWFALASDDGYITSPNLVALTATAVAESAGELDATGKRRTARLLGHLIQDIWTNIYGEPNPVVEQALRAQLPVLRRLMAEDDPATGRYAGRVLCRLRIRCEESAAYLMLLHGREPDPWRRSWLVRYLGQLGGRDMLPYLVDEVLVNDPAFLVRWRAARVVARLLRHKTPAEAADLLTGFLLDAEAQQRLEQDFPRLQGRTWTSIVGAIGWLAPGGAVPVLLGVLRQKGLRFSSQEDVVWALIRLTALSHPGSGPPLPLCPMQREVLTAIAEVWGDGFPVRRLAWSGLPATRQGLLDLLERG